MKGRALVTWQLSRSKNGNPPVTAKSAVAMARWADRASSLVLLLVALASAALADGDQLASVQLISTPEQLATLITQPLVSLVQFTEEDEVDTSFFETFASRIWQGSAISFAMCDATALRRAVQGNRGLHARPRAHSPDGIYLFARQQSMESHQLPMKITNEAEAQAAMA